MATKRDWWSAESASNAITAVIFIVAGIATVLLVNWNDRRLALHEAEDKALLLINRNLATHSYFTTVLKPPLLDLTRSGRDPDHFDPTWMSSSFAIREITRRFNDLSEDHYYYKDAAINARNPENEADAVERAFLAAASRPGGPEKWSGVRVIDGKPWFVTMRRGEVMDASCVRCHRDPAEAPRGLIERCGADRGFGRRQGELMSIVSIRVPLEDAYASANSFSVRLSVAMLAVLGAIFGATAAVNRRLVFAPLSRLRQHAALVASGSREVGTPVTPARGSDLQVLTETFNAMSSRVCAQRDDLERQVAERTRDALSSEARYKLLFDDNPMPMWLYDVESLAFIAVNSAAVEHYGYAREEFLAMTLRDIRPREDLPRLEAARARLPSLSRSGVFRHLKKSGAQIEVEIVSHELTFMGRRCRLVLANDVTERLRAERAVRDSEEQYRTTTDGIPMRIAYVDAEQRYRFVNHAYEVDLGRPRSAIVGRTVRELVGDRLHAKLRPYVEAALRGERVSFEMAFELSSGLRENSIVCVPRIDDQGNVLGFFSIAEDVTERRQLEAQFLQAQKMEAIGQLAGGVAHDFNNVMTVISSLANIVSQSDVLGEEDRSDIADIKRAARRATQLTRKLLAFSRKQTMQPRYVKLDAVVADSEKMLRRLVREDIELKTELTASDSGWVLADPAQLDQVLMNLVVNARDAMPSGGTITIHTAEMEADAELTRRHPGMAIGPHVLLSVTDTGVGMPPEVLAHAFEPFFTTKGKEHGTGLGLATVHGIVTQSGGHVQISSTTGQGTTVSVYLPRTEPKEEQATVVSRSASAHGTETVLLVEDDEDVRRVASRTLVGSGYTVLCASNGEEALQILARHGSGIALVLTDVVMPGIGGRELARRVGQLSAAPPPIVFMSGYAAGELGDNGVLGSDVAFIEKPFTSQSLVEAVRRLLDGAAAQPSAARTASG